MRFNKKMVISLLFLSFLMILVGTYTYINRQEQGKHSEKENKQLNEIAQKFNERNIIAYFEGTNVEVKAKVSTSTLYLYYVQNDKETSYAFELKQNILESKEIIDEVITGELLDTILNLKEESAYSFFGAINNHTIFDYSLEEDGLEFTKEEQGYKIKVNVEKELTVKEYFDIVINKKDIEKQVLKIEYNQNTYHQKGYIVYKEETDIKGNKVVTFAQYKDCNIENLRQSIANYLEMTKGKEIKEKFLKEVSTDALELQSYTKDNYELNNSYIVFKEDLMDECFDYYLSNNYRVVTLITDTK